MAGDLARLCRPGDVDQAEAVGGPVVEHELGHHREVAPERDVAELTELGAPHELRVRRVRVGVVIGPGRRRARRDARQPDQQGGEADPAHAPRNAPPRGNLRVSAAATAEPGAGR
ncbi:MAG TPA: hypothetical protein VHH36_02330, partial [Candidatus Thermoplasmatota archaeon]|nr:hypothetical protein [Candidatus Thermoplasmatota archaeon]